MEVLRKWKLSWKKIPVIPGFAEQPELAFVAKIKLYISFTLEQIIAIFDHSISPFVHFEQNGLTDGFGFPLIKIIFNSNSETISHIKNGSN